MDYIIIFFRDVLDGPLYVGVAITCGILICSCIGYLGEQYLNKQKEKAEFDSTHATVSSNVETPAPINATAQPTDGGVVTTNQGQ